MTVERNSFRLLNCEGHAPKRNEFRSTTTSEASFESEP